MAAEPVNGSTGAGVAAAIQGVTLTPSRRPTNTIGLSPIAKRADQRVTAPVPVTPGPNDAFSASELTRAVQFLSAQSELDKSWFESVTVSMRDHAEKLDAIMHGQVRMRVVEEQQKKQIFDMQEELKLNDEKVKTRIVEGHEAQKQLLRLSTIPSEMTSRRRWRRSWSRSMG